MNNINSSSSVWGRPVFSETDYTAFSLLSLSQDKTNGCKRSLLDAMEESEKDGSVNGLRKRCHVESELLSEQVVIEMLATNRAIAPLFRGDANNVQGAVPRVERPRARNQCPGAPRPSEKAPKPRNNNAAPEERNVPFIARRYTTR